MKAAYVAMVTALVLLSACGEQRDQVPPRSLPGPNASSAELMDSFASCENLPTAPPDLPGRGIDLVNETDGWWRVVEVHSHDDSWSDEEGPAPAIVTVESEIGILQQEVEVLFPVWSAVTWAGENEAEIYFGYQIGSDGTLPMLRTAVLVGGNGSAIFVGDCPGRMLNDQIRAELGSSPDEVLGNVVTQYALGGDAFADFLPDGELETPTDVENGEAGAQQKGPLPGPQTASPSHTVPQTLLNPDSYPIDELEAMNTVLVEYVSSGGVTGDVICSSNDVGWNDCVPVGESATLSGYLSGDSLHFWLIDATVPNSLGRPVASLGEVTIPSELRGENLSLGVHFVLSARRAGPEEQSMEEIYLTRVP